MVMCVVQPAAAMIRELYSANTFVAWVMLPGSPDFGRVDLSDASPISGEIGYREAHGEKV